MNRHSTFVVTHNNRVAKQVFSTVQAALQHCYVALDLREQFDHNQGSDHADRLASLLNFGSVNVYCYRIDVHTGKQAEKALVNIKHRKVKLLKPRQEVA